MHTGQLPLDFNPPPPPPPPGDGRAHDTALAGIATRARQEHAHDEAADWLGSPFAWLRELSSIQKSIAARDMLRAWLATIGVPAADGRRVAATLTLPGGRLAALKTSLLWSEGIYQFQQIKDWDYEVALLAGFSPGRAHLWAMPRAVLLARSEPQHSVDSRKLAFKADAPPAWLAEYGGTLPEAAPVLRALAAAEGGAT